MQKKTIFLSYSEYDSCIVNIIEKSLCERLGSSIIISRYTRDVGYKESFKSFMKSISKHDFVITVVSDKYLKSRACMFEVGEILKDDNFKKKLLFIVLHDEDKKYYIKSSKDDLLLEKVGADIYDPILRNKYVQYWEEEYIKLLGSVNEIISESAKIETLKLIRDIRKIIDFDITDFTSYLADARGFSFSEILMDDFKPIIDIIIPDIYGFNKFINLKDLLTYAICKISYITKTDYNQIILYFDDNWKQGFYIVVADKIANGKQKYRFVPNDLIQSRGLLSNCGVLSKLFIDINFENQLLGFINSESEIEEAYSKNIINEIEILSLQLGERLVKLNFSPYMRYREAKNLLPYISINETDNNY